MVDALASEIKYPIYVISKGRWDIGYTANFLLRDGVDFKLVIEPQEKEKYLEFYKESQLLILPFSNLGLGSIPARNWCWEHAKAGGHKRHWILDDNISGVMTFKNGKRTDCNSRPGFIAIEAFADRYKNCALASMQYAMFAFVCVTRKLPAFYLNSRCYSCILIDNELPIRWRGRYNEDTDLCLQALSLGYCTANINVFLIKKKATMTCKGGNMETLYKGDGRLKMARSLEEQWASVPGLVKTTRKFGRAQHHVNWKYFTHGLIRK